MTPRGGTVPEHVRFALVGFVNTVFSYGVFVLLELSIGASVPYLLIVLTTHVVAVLEAFALHRSVTFRASGRVWNQFLRFWTVYLVALAVNLALLPVLVEVAHIPLLPAQALVLLACATGSYAGHRHFSFRRSRDGSVGTRVQP